MKQWYEEFFENYAESYDKEEFTQGTKGEVETSIVEVVDDSGKKKTLTCNDRSYTPSEITWYLKSLGFKNIGIFGCNLGQFSRNDPLTKDDHEMLVIAELA